MIVGLTAGCSGHPDGTVDSDDRPPGLVDLPNNRTIGVLDFSLDADAEHRVDNDVPIGGFEFAGGARKGSHFLEVELSDLGGNELLRLHEEHADSQSCSGELSGRDETVAPVVASAAEDRDSRGFLELLADGARNRVPRVLHQPQSRDSQVSRVDIQYPDFLQSQSLSRHGPIKRGVWT